MTSSNAVMQFDLGDTSHLFSAVLPAPSPGWEMANDPVWASKLARALAQSDSGESRSWADLKAELAAGAQGHAD